LYKKAGQLDGIINDTTDFQVYEGYTWWNQNYQKYRDTTIAINATKGQILTYKGKPIEAYYSSTNGGTQLSVTNSWGTSLSNYPYLTKRNDPYSAKTGAHMNWSFSVNKEQMDISKLDLEKPSDWWDKEDAPYNEKDKSITSAMKQRMIVVDNNLKGANLKIVEVSDMTFDTPPFDAHDILSGSFKVKYFVKGKDGFVMENGKLKLHTKTISSKTNTLRSYFGTSVFKSPNVKEVKFDGTKYMVKGDGFGHGIGLSQYGSQQQAVEGRSFKQILDFYYQGTSWDNTIYQSINSSLQGETRYDTSAAIANYGWSSAKTVVLGRGDNPVDALTGSVLAKKHDAPLLLVRTDKIDESVLKTLDKFRPSKIYILGGTSAISSNVENQLKNKYTKDVERVNGKWRADTSVAIANEIASSSKEVIVTT
ncbi:cell wall-binding repeat-containing protein, partial [Paenibacillus phytohabitans]